MNITRRQVLDDLRFLKVLARQYPTIQSASTEIINLQAILNLPKGTEHFMSDLHGEYEAFLHIMGNASGAIREKVDLLYQNTLSQAQRAALATLIYYPEQKLKEVKEETPQEELGEWYRLTLGRLVEVCRLVASKYTRSKVRKALPPDFEYIIDELLHTTYDERNKGRYYENIIATIIEIERGDAFIAALCGTIKRLVIDRLHIVGDIYDRGPRADIVMDSLMAHHCVDIQWGNHDVLWMGAAAGSRTCIANVLNNSITYNNLEVVENGYGISLRPLALFAAETYGGRDMAAFLPKGEATRGYSPKDIHRVACMHKAIAVIQFKLEGQIILRNPGFLMGERMLLHKIDRERGTVRLDGRNVPLKDTDFPTVDPADPYALSEEEARVMEQLKFSFLQSEKLQRHVRFLYAKGGLYKCFNDNLLLHGCVPLREDGSFLPFSCEGEELAGRAFLDYAEGVARQGYYAQPHSPQRQQGKDYLWYLWCGKNSPLFGRERIATFERLLCDDERTWEEPKNPYYLLYERPDICEKILREFGLGGPGSHIVNGHVPVRTKDGENPVKAGGKLIVIDGGFCQAYQPKTGIAGYTLIYNSYGLRIVSHSPFEGVKEAIRQDRDILSTTVLTQATEHRIQVGETDVGQEIRENIDGLRKLLAAYRMGLIKQDHSH